VRALAGIGIFVENGDKEFHNNSLSGTNQQRPHEALGQQTSARHYTHSARAYPARVLSPDYDSSVTVRRVNTNREIRWKGDTVYLSETLCGENVGLSQRDDRYWTIRFGPLIIWTVGWTCSTCYPYTHRCVTYVTGLCVTYLSGCKRACPEPCRRGEVEYLFSYQPSMSVATDTTKDENAGRVATRIAGATGN